MIAGGCVVVQQALNATLRSELGSAFWAAFISYTAGTLTLVLVLVVIRQPWLTLSTIAKSSPPPWIGGVFGTVYIVASIMLLPRLGAMTVVGYCRSKCSPQWHLIILGYSASHNARLICIEPLEQFCSC